ncbi:MAG: LysM peptidoglycan-binding domain-containing protein [Chloroflexi bacterium]|nr:LysM peptidoglycan-binding domain-containing protein [Chloroflexota bacterium]
MNRRLLGLLTAVLALALVVPTSQALADYFPEDCEDGEWEVRPDQTLGFIAFTCGTTVTALVEYNNIENPNLINTGTILLIPPADFVPGSGAPAPAPEAGDQPDVADEAPEVEPTAPPPPPSGGTGQVSASLGPIRYDEFRSFAEVQATVTNLGVQQGVAGGRYYPPQPGDDGPQWVTLVGAIHTNPPYPAVNNEPLWKATVYFNDGTSNLVYAGCEYRETVFAEGDEPLDRANDIWFHWEITLEGGWFDCGNTLSEQRHPPDLFPGQSGSSTLRIYLEHPRLWDDSGPIQDKRVVRIDMEVFTTAGESLGVVTSQTY